jgi:farnesyl diphosphate synthase
MAFSQRLERSAQLVEQRLAALIDAAAAAGTPERLVAAMRHAALGGGKRLRPFLVVESAALFGVPAEATLDAAAAVECVHCYSLVHDDLPAMDDDDLRRGRPTVHKAFDDWTAILAGDALLTLAFEALTTPLGRGADPATATALVAALARAAGAAGMVGGQCLDLEADKLGAPPRPDAAHVERLQAMKTGALMRWSCEAGAILGGAGTNERVALATYGARLGLVFQIADDILDVEGDAAAMGKAAHKDQGKATLHAASDIATARRRLGTLTGEAVAALAPFGSAADILREAVVFAAQRKG